MLKCIFTFLVLTLITFSPLNAQVIFEVEGNGLFNQNSGTTLDITNQDDNTNALVRFGDNNLIKYALGYNGNEDAFKISSSTTLGADDFTMSPDGLIGINSLYSGDRILINHNSLSGVDGSAHLALRSTNTSGFSVVNFENLGDDNYFDLSAKATQGNAILNIHHDDGLNEANIMSFDGDNFRVGLHTETPEAYLHLRQEAFGVDVLAIENSSGNDKWSMRIGDEDILIYYNNGLRGGFDVSTGDYNNFPPSAMPRVDPAPSKSVLDQILSITPVSYKSAQNHRKVLGIVPGEGESGEISPYLASDSINQNQVPTNYEQLTIMTLQAIQERHEIIINNREKIDSLKKRTENNRKLLEKLSSELDALKN